MEEIITVLEKSFAEISMLIRNQNSLDLGDLTNASNHSGDDVQGLTIVGWSPGDPWHCSPPSTWHSSAFSAPCLARWRHRVHQPLVGSSTAGRLGSGTWNILLWHNQLGCHQHNPSYLHNFYISFLIPSFAQFRTKTSYHLYHSFLCITYHIYQLSSMVCR